MVGLPADEEMRKCLAVSIQYTIVTDVQTDGQTDTAP